MELVEFVVECARIPSFSTYEDRLHPFIYDSLSDRKDVSIDNIFDNNLLVQIEGKKKGFPVLISSHLDKINHFGTDYPKVLNVVNKGGKIIGQMDDAVGVGICMYLASLTAVKNWPDIILAFSEMEESFGLKNHPHLLKNNGCDVGPQIGAKRLCAAMDEKAITPALCLTIDTTPVFKGESGIAIYTEHWDKTGVLPDAELLRKIESLKSFFLQQNASIKWAQGNNDYLEYGRHFSVPERGNVPSIAVEPAIFPYHQIGESVFVENVIEIARLIEALLDTFDFSFVELK